MDLECRYAIAGAGGLSSEVLSWCRDAYPDSIPVGLWAPSRDCRSTALDRLPLLEDLRAVRESGATHVVLAIGSNELRRRLWDEAVAGGLELLRLVHPSARVGPGSTIGPGAVVGPGVTMTIDASIGAGVLANAGCHIGHGSGAGDFSSIGPMAVLSGSVTIHEGATIGANATIVQGLEVGANAVVGAGAVVVRAVAPGVTVFGNPAKRVFGDDRSSRGGEGLPDPD